MTSDEERYEELYQDYCELERRFQEMQNRFIEVQATIAYAIHPFEDDGVRANDRIDTRVENVVKKWTAPPTEQQCYKALVRCQELFKVALPKFNWGASLLDAEAIRLLNDVPGEVSRLISKINQVGK